MKFKRWLAHLRRSIFFKIVLIFFATAILLMVLLALSANYLSDPQRFVHQKIEANIHAYATHLIDKIGNPPDYNKANELAETLGLEIQIQSSGKSWQSKTYSIPADYQRKMHKISQRDNLKIGHYRGFSLVIIKRDHNIFSFAINHKRFTENKVFFLISLIAIIIIVISFCYLLIRWLLKPVSWLTAGVAEVSRGNFKAKVPVRKHDELGELTESFNNMASQIDSMMQSKQQLLLDVSHELRSPLTRMKLAMEFMGDSEIKNNLQDDVREMETMITELLESARLTNNNQLRKIRFSITEMLADIIYRYEKNQPGIIYHKSNSPVILEADQERIQILLRNVLDNAIKYSKHQAKPVEVTLADKENNILIIVHDYGEGIPASDLPHIFEPFFRVDKSRNIQTGGYGLGLSLCHKIVKAHAGEITVESELGVYTQVRIELPK